MEVWPCGENRKYKIAKRVYVGMYASICSVGMPWKGWIDTVKGVRKRKIFSASI